MIDWDEIYTLKPHFPIFTAKMQRKTSDYEQEKVITNRRIDSIYKNELQKRLCPRFSDESLTRDEHMMRQIKAYDMEKDIE